jgi:hypothetical protein
MWPSNQDKKTLHDELGLALGEWFFWKIKVHNLGTDRCTATTSSRLRLQLRRQHKKTPGPLFAKLFGHQVTKLGIITSHT